MNNLIGLCVNDGDDVLLVAHGDGLPVGAPAQVDVLPLGLHCVCALASWGWGRGQGGMGVGVGPLHTTLMWCIQDTNLSTHYQPTGRLAPPTSDIPDLDRLVSRR